MRQEASCFCEAKVSPVAHSANPVTVNWLSDKRYLCVRINYQAGSFSRQSKSRHDRRLYLEKTEVYSPANQNFIILLHLRTYPRRPHNQSPYFFHGALLHTKPYPPNPSIQSNHCRSQDIKHIPVTL